MKFYSCDVAEWENKKESSIVCNGIEQEYRTSSSFKGKLLDTYAKADISNRAKLAYMFPNLKIAYDMWFCGETKNIDNKMR